MAPEIMQKLLIDVMEVERRYAFELRNVKADRRGEVIEVINRIAGEDIKRDEAHQDQAG